MRAIPSQPDRGSIVGRVVLAGKSVHIPDVPPIPNYLLLEAREVESIRTVLGVPLLREGTPIGVSAGSAQDGEAVHR